MKEQWFGKGCLSRVHLISGEGKNEPIPTSEGRAGGDVRGYVELGAELDESE